MGSRSWRDMGRLAGRSNNAGVATWDPGRTRISGSRLTGNQPTARKEQQGK